jgi:hypothetical protein
MNETDGGLGKVIWRRYPVKSMAEFAKRVCETLYVACPVVEEVEAHVRV